MSPVWTPTVEAKIVSASGAITCQDSSGKLQTVPAPTYGSSEQRLNKQHLQFTQKLALLQLKDAREHRFQLLDSLRILQK